MRKYLTILIMLTLLFSISCGQQKSEDTKITISVIPKGTSHVFWQSIYAGAVIVIAVAVDQLRHRQDA